MNNTIKNGIKSTKDLGMKYSSYLDEKDFNEMILEGRTEDEYLEDYCMIIDYALLRGLKREKLDFYTEKHHILPRCMEGEDSDYNYVLLSALEHIIVHILLYRIYPNNSKIIYATDCILQLNSRSTFERNKAIDKIENIKLISELRTLVRNLRKRQIACYVKENDTIVIKKIYDSITDAKLDGVGGGIGQELNNSKNTAGGYYWIYLSDLENLNNNFKIIFLLEETIKYSKRKVNEKISNLRKEKSDVVCIDPKDESILWIYSKIVDAKKDGFSNISISKALNIPSKNNIVFGYKWVLLSEYEKIYPNKVKNFYIKRENGLINPPKARTLQIACLNINREVMKIYDKLSDVVNDGFSKTSVCTSITNNNFYLGYYWSKLNDLENIKYSDNYGTVEKIKSNEPVKVVKCSKDGEILGIYNSYHNIDSFDYRAIFKTVNRENKLYRGYYWYKLSEYIQLFPENYKTYINHE